MMRRVSFSGLNIQWMVNQWFCAQFHLLIVILTTRFLLDVSGLPVARIESSDVQRQRLDIYKRQNSEFNRLQSNQIDYSAYANINDEAPSKEENDINTAESRRFGGIRRRPCVPVYPYRQGKKQRRRNGGQYDGQVDGSYNGRYEAPNDGRTLYDLNFYFLGYQPNRYQVNPGSQTGAAISAVDDNKPVSQSQYEHYGGYYDCEPNPFYRPPYGVGSNTYGDGGALYNDPNRPTSLTGLLGQSLFDFINGLFGYGNPNAGGGSGGFDTPVSPGAASVLNEETDVKPVWEINVPDTISALVKHSCISICIQHTFGIQSN